MGARGGSSHQAPARRRARLAELAAQPRGARWVRADLQVHTPADPRFEHGAAPQGGREREALARAYLGRARERGIDVVGITEHDDVSWVPTMLAAGEAVGVAVLPGFEIESGEGVHMLCLFDADTALARLEQALADTRAPGGARRTFEGRVVRQPFAELLDTIQNGYGGVCIAAHADNKKGLLRAVGGQARRRMWLHRELLAVELGERSRSRPNLRKIVTEKDPLYRRERPLAHVRTSDSRSPKTIGTERTWLRVSDISAEGLRQAFLEPRSRVALSKPAAGAAGGRLVAAGWQGGFLDESNVGFADGLTCVIGRSGSGKSALVETIRGALGCGCATERFGREVEALRREVLPDGATLTLVVQTAGGERYLIEWRAGAVAAVFDADGQPRADLDPATLLDARVYGQGEIDAIAASPAAQLALLDRVGGTAEGGGDAGGAGGAGGPDGNSGPGADHRRDAAARINEALKDRVRVRVPAGGTHAGRVEISLNVGLPHRRHDYRPLDRLSPGQRAAAIWAVLLETLTAEGAPGRGGGGGPVIVDQPERGLDQPWICEHLVARLRELKRTRQVIVATANSSIALLCDAEQFVPLEAAQWPGAAHPRGILAARGSLDRAPIREATEHVLEGGPTPHALREAKYGARV